MSRVYFVRHGSHGLVDRALAGRMAGVHLSTEGEEQAAELARHFETVPVSRILSSPIDRCRETAAPIAERCGVPVEIEPALTEIDCGAWTGAPFEQLREDPRWHAWNAEREHTSIPDGESVPQVRQRVMALLDELVGADRGPTLLVSHSDVIKTAVLTLLGAPLEHYNRLAVDPASVTTVDLWRNGGKVVRLNQGAGA